jgi:methyl-accepting chemotaxis protein
MTMSIRTKLLAAFALNLALLVALGIFSLVQVEAMHEEAAFLGETIVPSEINAGLINAGINTYRSLQGSHAVNSDAAAMAQIESEMADVANQVDAILRNHEPLIDTEDERAIFERLQSLWPTFVSRTQQEFLPPSRNDDNESTLAAYTGLESLYDELARAASTAFWNFAGS